MEPVAEDLLNRHLRSTKEWFPHELIPWGQGRDYASGEPWPADEHVPAPGIRSALLVNLLTEENLPYYYAALDHLGFRDGAWGEWSRRWTAEEARHGAVIRDYVLVTRTLDARALERDRMHAMTRGFDASAYTLLDAIVYAAFQELATRVAHHNTGKLLDDPCGYRIMARVAVDENLHFLFYRELVEGLLQTYPSATVCAIERQVVGFAMPGSAIPRFRRHSLAIAAAGIYDLDTHYRSVLEPLIRAWNIEAVAELTSEAQRARDRLFSHLARVERTAARVRKQKVSCTEIAHSNRDGNAKPTPGSRVHSLERTQTTQEREP